MLSDKKNLVSHNRLLGHYSSESAVGFTFFCTFVIKIDKLETILGDQWRSAVKMPNCFVPNPCQPGGNAGNHFLIVIWWHKMRLNPPGWLLSSAGSQLDWLISQIFWFHLCTPRWQRADALVSVGPSTIQADGSASNFYWLMRVSDTQISVLFLAYS